MNSMHQDTPVIHQTRLRTKQLKELMSNKTPISPGNSSFDLHSTTSQTSLNTGNNTHILNNTPFANTIKVGKVLLSGFYKLYYVYVII